MVLGIGNILLGDEGVGVHLCNFLRLNYTFVPKQAGELVLDCVDGGTMAQALIPLIVDYERMLILDCVSVSGAKVGEVYCFDFDKIPEKITWAGSAHEVEMLQTLRLTALMQDLPPTTIIGLVPSIIAEDTSFSLSEPMLRGAQVALQSALEVLQKWGVCARLKPHPRSLQEVAHLSYKL